MSGFCDSPVIATTNAITPGNEGFALYEATSPRSVFVFPQIYDNLNNWSNEVHLQNINPFGVTAILVLRQTNGTLLGTQAISIPPTGKKIIRPYTLITGSNPRQVNGSLHVTVTNGHRITAVNVSAKTTFFDISESVGH